MSDIGGDRGAAPAPGWWRAADGNWYPPTGAVAPPAPTTGWTPPPPPTELRRPEMDAMPPPPTGYGPAPAYGYGHGYAPGPTSTNGLAIAALVLGILWLYWIGSVLALIFGLVAKAQIDSSGGRQSGRGLAIAGIVLGAVGLAALALVILSVVVFVDSVNDQIREINEDDGFRLLLGPLAGLGARSA